MDKLKQNKEYILRVLNSGGYVRMTIYGSAVKYVLLDNDNNII